MKKQDRQIVFDKYGGKCAYCGTPLVKGWHVDHILPVVRHLDDPKKLYYPDRHCAENYNPACASCNIMKSSGSIEDLRQTIAKFINSLNEYSTQYKFAKRYGLVQETRIDVKFYFERLAEEMETPQYVVRLKYPSSFSFYLDGIFYVKAQPNGDIVSEGSTNSEAWNNAKINIQQ
jgi:hypothetical protein